MKARLMKCLSAALVIVLAAALVFSACTVNLSEEDIQEISFSAASIEQTGEEINNGYFSFILPDKWSYTDWRDAPHSKDELNGVPAYYADLRKPGVYRINIRVGRQELAAVDTGRRDTEPKARVSITVGDRTLYGYHGLLFGNTYICRLNLKDGDYLFSLTIEKYRGVVSEEDTDLLLVMSSLRKN